MVVFGTRPEAIKMAPLVRALQESPLYQPIVVVTAQHREMLDQVLSLFAIEPDHDLNVSTPRQGLAQLSARVLERLAPVMHEERPDAVVVQGDTVTTLCGALAAFYARIPVAHMEAGLRTGTLTNPFPEEMDRRLTTRLSSLHLAATLRARDNLYGEGITPAEVVVTGNTVIDALLWTVEQERPSTDPLVAACQRHPGDVVLVTTHRRESWGTPMRRVAEAVVELARRHPSVLFCIPLHANPIVQEAVVPTVAGQPNVVLGEPADYVAFVQLMQRARILLTDSGGVQEEGPTLGKPVLVTRDATERPEAVTAGVARLVGTDKQRIVSSVTALLVDPIEYAAMANAVNPYGDGNAAHRTVEALGRLFGETHPVDEFLTADREPALVGVG